MGSSGVDAPGSALTEESVMVNVATPYLRVGFALTGTDLRVSWPETILGLIPVRLSRLAVPLTDLTSIRFRHKVIPTRLAIVILLVSLVVIFDLPRFAIALGVVLAVWLLLVSIVGVVEVADSRGQWTIPVCLLQKRAVIEFIRRVGLEGTTSQMGTP